jgi:calcium-dependent protein kinase
MGCTNTRKAEFTVISKINQKKTINKPEISALASSQTKSSSSNSKKNHSLKLIKEKNEKIEEDYMIIEKIGSGAYGNIFKVEHVKSGFIRAMKIVKKENLNTNKDDIPNFMNEIKILMDIDHPNVMKIFEYYSDDLNYYIITEFISGGDLYEFIIKTKKFTERQAALIIYQILSSLNYMHSKNIIHRDIKPENILITDDINIKIIDFGMSVRFEDKKLKDLVGTSYYMAPEVIRREYGPKCDIWSCGIILHILLVGYPPFHGKNYMEIFEKILQGKLNNQIENSEWKRITPLAKDILSKMLTYDPEHRLSAEEGIRHPWIVGSHAREEDLNEEIALDALGNIRNFSAREKLRVATMAYIVHFVYASKDVSNLYKMFKIFDKNSDGKLTLKEFKTGYEKYYGNVLKDYELKNIFEEIDQNGDGFIEYEEFLRATINQKQMMAEQNLKMAFDQFDENGDNKLSFDEIKLLLGGDDDEYVLNLIKKYDMDNDGCVSFSEYVCMMNEIIEI